ncbi:MAG TPA: glutathione S-transferase family protein [Candidatus Acidoferrum sp.]|nr:glutathione S-transferase family protein [Candidatus Acidoferrum sp.]
MALVFYCGSGSPFAWKVWLTLEHKQIAYEFKLLSFDRGDTRSPEFLAVNPRGQVPTIVDNGFALWESHAIVEYLEEQYPQRRLMPSDPKGRATVRRLMHEADNHLSEAQTELFEATLFRKADVAEDAAKIAAGQDKLLKELARWDALLTGEYLAGALSLADFGVYPFVRQVRRIDERQPKNGLGERMPARLRAWMQRIEALPYYAKTIPPHWKG